MAKKGSQEIKPRKSLPRLMGLAMIQKAPMVGGMILSALATIASFLPYLAIYFIIQEIVGAPQGKTIIIAEHRTWYLKNLVDRAIYMEDGKIVREYTMAELAQFTIEEQLQSGIRTVDLLSYPTMLYTTYPAEHMIELKDIHCFYGKSEALSIPELSINSGQITAIIGTNGAGKSTFVSCMCGLMKKVKWNDSAGWEKANGKKTGMSFCLLSPMTTN